MLIKLICIGNAIEIESKFDDRFYCHGHNGSKIDSTEKILVLSPEDHYFYQKVKLESINAKFIPNSFEKKFANVITISGMFNEISEGKCYLHTFVCLKSCHIVILDEKTCKTWIELPQLREMSDLIRVVKYLSKRCFDKILLYIDMQESQTKENNMVFHQIEFLKHVYGNEIQESIGAIVLNSTELSQDMLSTVNEYKVNMHFADFQMPF